MDNRPVHAMNEFLSQYTTQFYLIMYVVLMLFCVAGWRRTRQAGFVVLLLWALLGVTTGLTQQFGTETLFKVLTRFTSADTASSIMTSAFSLIVVGLMGLLTLGVGLLAFVSRGQPSR